MKHILTIQDLSCVGRCSLTVALPVLSAMGLRCSVLPTAVLSTHTAFPGPRVQSLTDQLLPFAKHWKSLGISFDAISVGYLSDPAQADAVGGLLRLLDAPLVILDPVLGDNGKLYSRMTQAHLEAVRRLCAQADVLLPNVTEAAFLTGNPYEEQPENPGKLLESLQTLTPRVAVTGLTAGENSIGVCGAEPGKPPFFRYTQRIPRQFHGTGDLFAAVLSGSLLRGLSLEKAAARAMEFVRCCVAETERESPHGVEFERQLFRLCED